MPHDRQTSPAGCAAGTAGAAAGTGTGTGAGAGGSTAAGGGTGTGAGAGAPAGESPVFAPQFPQNFSSGKRGEPQERQVGVRGAEGAGGMAAGASSMSDAPQFRQNFCENPTFLPHSGQNGIKLSRKRHCTRSIKSIALQGSKKETGVAFWAAAAVPEDRLPILRQHSLPA